MKTAQLICSCLLLFAIADSSQARWKSSSYWWWNYYNKDIPETPVPDPIPTPVPDDSAPVDTNLPPSITGAPASTVTEGQSYTFTPSASDPEGDPLTFSVSNLPDWASFDSQTGTLIGTPSTASTGLYVDIVISVSDAAATASLDPISITVNPATVATGAVAISWVSPTDRTDHSPLSLSEIDGYRIYMGETIDNLSLVIDLNDGAATHYSFTDLASGTYYFAVTAYDVDGNESPFSNIANKSIM